MNKKNELLIMLHNSNLQSHMNYGANKTITIDADRSILLLTNVYNSSMFSVVFDAATY